MPRGFACSLMAVTVCKCNRAESYIYASRCVYAYTYIYIYEYTTPIELAAFSVGALTPQKSHPHRNAMHLIKHAGEALTRPGAIHVQFRERDHIRSLVHLRVDRDLVSRCCSIVTQHSLEYRIPPVHSGNHTAGYYSRNLDPRLTCNKFKKKKQKTKNIHH